MSVVSNRRSGPLLGMAVITAFTVVACTGTGATSAPPASSAATSAPASSSASASASAPASGASGSPAAQVSIPAPEKTSIKIGLSTAGEASEFAPYYAMQLGLYKKYGFTSVEVPGFEGEGKTVQAVIAGAIDFGDNGVSSVISSLKTDTPLKSIGLNGVTLTDMLVCGAKYKSAADIKGQKVAVSSFGSTAHGSVLILLDQLGLTDKDVTITQVGSQDVRLAAVKAGSVACAPIDLAQKAAVQQAGLSILGDNKSSGKQFGRAGIEAIAENLQKYPNTALAALAAILEAQNQIFLTPDDAAKKFQDYSQQTAEQSKAVIDDFVTWGDRSMSWTDEAFEVPKTVLESVDPTISNVDITQAYDKSFLQKLADMGFYQSIGDPTLPFTQ